MANTIVQVGTLRELENISLAPGDYEISMFLPVSLSQPQVESIRSGLASSNVQLLQPIRYDPTTNKLTIYARQPDLSGIAFGLSDITGGISNVLGGITGVLLSPFTTIIKTATSAVLVPVLVVAGIATVLIMALGWSASKVGNTKAAETAARSAMFIK
ncbi:MAG: hypothetical protein WC359_12850 [Dehalococcoidia bacterium]|jgi:hypothetical protein